MIPAAINISLNLIINGKIVMPFDLAPAILPASGAPSPRRALDLLIDGQRFPCQPHCLRSIFQAILRQAHLPEGFSFASTIVYLLAFLQLLLILLDCFPRLAQPCLSGISRKAGKAESRASLRSSSRTCQQSGRCHRFRGDRQGRFSDGSG